MSSDEEVIILTLIKGGIKNPSELESDLEFDEPIQDILEKLEESGKIEITEKKGWLSSKSEISLTDKGKKSINFDTLLDKFEIKYLQGFCNDVIGEEPEGDVEEQEDEETEERIATKYEPTRRHYRDFIWEKFLDDEIRFSQIKDYALKNRIVAPSFFEEEQGQKKTTMNDFEMIINEIKSNFEPEKITDEEHLQSQLTIFLKARFPTKKVSREIRTKIGDKLDIVIDDKYVFEVKVPTDRTTLRNLSAQIEEYKQEYPNLCAIIFDNEELNLTSIIKDYVDKYKRDYEVTSVVLTGSKRA